MMHSEDKPEVEQQAMTMPMQADGVLNRYFLEMRAKVLDIGAAIDRIERADGGEAALRDARMDKLREAIGVLLSDESERAERILMLFSDPYEPGWPRPAKR